MNKYTIPCTEEQTKKALELGAPIEYANIVDIRAKRFVNSDTGVYTIPTAEQMLGWLEGLGITSIEITFSKETKWKFEIFSESYDFDAPYNSRREATLAAIDAALEYLSKATEED